MYSSFLCRSIVIMFIIVVLTSCPVAKSYSRVTPSAASRPTEPRQQPGPSPAPSTALSTPATVISPAPTETPESISNWELSYPYPIPTSCAVTPLQGPYKWIGFPAYWLVADGIRAGFEDVIYASSTKVMLHLDQRSAATMAGEHLGSLAPPPELDVRQLVGSGYVSSMSFPAPGCWMIDIEAGAASLKATVYVYPDSCRPQPLSGTPIATPAAEIPQCRPPD